MSFIEKLFKPNDRQEWLTPEVEQYLLNLGYETFLQGLLDDREMDNLKNKYQPNYIKIFREIGKHNSPINQLRQRLAQQLTGLRIYR